MHECPPDRNYSMLPPPGFNGANVTVKRGELVELLQQIIDKCQQDPTFLVEQPKQIDLLVSVVQLTLLSTPITFENRRDFLTNILSIGQDLLSDQHNLEIESAHKTVPIDIQKQTTDEHFSLDDLANEYLQNEPTPSSSNEKSSTPDEAIRLIPTTSVNIDADGDFSLDDLANEYLQNEPTPSSLNEKAITPNETDEPALGFDNCSQTHSSSSAPVSNVQLTLVISSTITEPIPIKAPLESILFSNRLSSSDAADDADCIWKDRSSAFGQMFCKKIDEISLIPTKRISSCLLDRSLYERLTRLIALLPKQCVRNSVQQQQIIRPNEQNSRSIRVNNDVRRQPPSHRPTFQQNSAQMHNRQQAPLNSRQHSNYYYQQTNNNEHFIDRRQQQYQNRYPPANFAPYPNDQQYPPQNNPYNNNQQQQQYKKKPQNNNNQTAYPTQQRGPKKGGGGGGGHKPNHDKSGATNANTKPK